MRDGPMNSVARILHKSERRKVRRRRARLPSLDHEPVPEGTAGELPGEQLHALRSIRHVIVLMMENHSFDNYFGMMTGVDGHQGKAHNPNRTGDGRTAVDPYHLPSTRQYPQVPTQSWYASHLQYDDGRCDGFVKSSETIFPRNPHGDAAMGYWTEADLPFYYRFAREFTVADRWFASCLGPTLPNRRFLVAATANGLIHDAPYDLLDRPAAGTIFDVLTAHGISWANYHHASTLHTLLRRPLRVARSKLQFTADVYPLDMLGRLNHLRSIHRLRADIERDALPQVCFIDPDYEQTSEENPQDISDGQEFARKVIEQLRQGPQWPHTVLIWCYDEGGGYYDHVPPPAAPPPDEIDGRSITDAHPYARLLARMVGSYRTLQMNDRGDKRFDRLGFRVPAVIAGPFAKAGHVSHTTYDHTSILKLIELVWDLPPLTHRDAAASAPLDCLNLTARA